MKFRSLILAFLALGLFAACASTKVTQETPIVDPGLARPNRSTCTTSSPIPPRFLRIRLSALKKRLS
jgi:hypothetical protein